MICNIALIDFVIDLELELELILSQMAQYPSCAAASTIANAAGLSGCACVMRMRSGGKEEAWDKPKEKRVLLGGFGPFLWYL